MKIIKHRVNKSSELIMVPQDYGVEIDLRSEGNEIILSHDPFLPGELFEDWIKNYKHNHIILNVKEEGLEIRILNILAKNNIDNFFFLDQSFPFLINLSKKLQKKTALRFSEYESFETIKLSKGKANWVWVDYFSKFPLSVNQSKLIHTAHNQKICIVSPELQGHTDKTFLTEFANMIRTKGYLIDAVCTKFPELWV